MLAPAQAVILRAFSPRANPAVRSSVLDGVRRKLLDKQVSIL